ncbi:MAG: ATP-binding protein, partial [Candidatus Acidifodinimicrobium sp.]
LAEDSSWIDSSANWEKLLPDFRSNYEENNDLFILFIELIANSLDAGASEVNIEIDPNHQWIKFLDNGKGMDGEAFKEYHNLGSLSKERGKGIGFAGVGAKLYIDLCSKIETVTKQKGSSLGYHSIWLWDNIKKRPKYKPEEIKGEEYVGKHGTLIKVYNPKGLTEVSLKDIENKILENYNFALKPYGTLAIKLNGKQIEPRILNGKIFDASASLRNKRSHIRISGKIVYDPTCDDPEIHIIVYGKTVSVVSSWVDSLPFKKESDKKHICGYLRCDDLIDAVSSIAKNHFNTSSTTWKEFEKSARQILTNALQYWGLLKPLTPESENVETAVATQISAIINELFKDPDVSALSINPFQALRKSPTIIKDDDGTAFATSAQGRERVPGTRGGPNSGGIGVTTEGPFEGEGLTESPEGINRGRKVDRLKHTGINVTFMELDGMRKAIITSEEIIIDMAYPEFVLVHEAADKKGVAIESLYTLDSVVEALCNQKETPEEIEECRHKLYEKLRQLGRSRNLSLF